MKTEIKFYHLWDWKTVVVTGSILIITFALYVSIAFSSELILNYKLFHLEGETVGRIIRIKEQVGMHQSRYGNKSVIDHYTVWYTYTVKGKNYTKVNRIQGNKKNAWLLKKLISDLESTVNVKFDLSNPEKSLINLE